MMKTRLAATAALAVTMLAPVAAFAQSPAAAPQGRGGPLEACRADVDQLCATAERIQGWRGKCLRDNAAKLSDGCKSALAAMQEQRQKVRAACATDIAELCKSDAAEGGRPMRCLKGNEAKLSAGCKSAMASFSDGDEPAKQ